MSVSKLAVVIACLLLGTRSQPTDDVSFNGINEFSLRLLDNIAVDTDENFVVSAVSAWNLFALIAEGASGKTYEELMLQLNLPKNSKVTRSLFTSAGEILSTNATQVTLQRVGYVIIDNSLPVHQEFCELSSRDYKTDVNIVDTTDKEELARNINYKVCYATNGRIREAVISEQLNELRLMLIDAIFFKGQWTKAFEEKDTKEENFYDDRGRKIGTVNMMFQKAKNPLVYVETISAQALELTYGPEQKFSMIILLPDQGTPLKRFLKKLSTFSLKDLSESLRQEEAIEVDCYIPRFKISSDLNLIQPLRYMGFNEIFSDSLATLPGISESPLFVSSVLQKAEIEVTEVGTVAAAATVVGLEDRILGPRVEMNRPFVYLIVERESNLLLFSGVYNSPSVF